MTSAADFYASHRGYVVPRGGEKVTVVLRWYDDIHNDYVWSLARTTVISVFDLATQPGFRWQGGTLMVGAGFTPPDERVTTSIFRAEDRFFEDEGATWTRGWPALTSVEIQALIASYTLGDEEGAMPEKLFTYGFMPFQPGAGVGGHCIAVDHQYLAWKMKTLQYTSRFITVADEINTSMPAFVVDRVAEALNDRFGKALNGAKVLLVGVAYKRDVGDTREAPAAEVAELLMRRKSTVAYADPLVTAFCDLERVSLNDAADFDAVVIVTAHTGVDYAGLVERARLIVDCQDVARGPNTVSI